MTDEEQRPLTKSISDNALLLQIKQLIDSGSADNGRLLHIYEMLSTGRALYRSDEEYLKSLLQTSQFNSMNYSDIVNYNPLESTVYSDSLDEASTWHSYQQTTNLADADFVSGSSATDSYIRSVGAATRIRSGVSLPHRAIFSRTETQVPNEFEIQSIVNQTLSENMPMFEKVISSMIAHQLNKLGINPQNSENLSSIPILNESEIVNAFSQLNFIKTISYSKHNSQIKLVVIHNESDNLKAFDMIEDVIIALEEKISDFSIEPWILHESEVQDSFLSGTTTIFSK
ncbi:MAG: hypothetical protein K5798_03445 [Nitrosopumilus sp.]|uniref:hypothetical protein n=1 Tax=Nitrosopumilus sp. TaxID=2024843 RepID=UPI00242B0BE5|nr:hypothetical protein [Nitrosopumilus sp.]MCV0366306.1 hypothetical protein [Nitrosopumilus sp.]